MEIKIKKLTETAHIPSKGTPLSAGYDLYCAEPCPTILMPGDNYLISTGITTEIPEGYFGAIFPRSGLAVKQGLRLANCVAVIDSDYRGEWKVPLFNDSKENRIIEPGDRIAQVVFIPYTTFNFEVVDDLNNTNRGSGGFGHSGVK